MHPSYISNLVPIYESSAWHCAYGAGVLRVPIAWVVPVYLATEIFVSGVQFELHKQICYLTTKIKCVAFYKFVHDRYLNIFRTSLVLLKKNFVPLSLITLFFKLPKPVKSRKMIWSSSNFRRMFSVPITVVSVKDQSF